MTKDIQNKTLRRNKMEVLKTIKILIISYSFPPCTLGAATIMYNLCKYLPKESFQVITASSELAIDNGDYDPEYALKCSTIRLPVRKYRGKSGLIFLLLSVLKGFIICKKKEFKCLLAVYPSEYDLYAAYILRKITGKPLIIYMHDLFSEVKKGAKLYKIFCFLERKIFSSASAIIVTNEKFKQYYLKKGIPNIIVLHSCVDLDREEQEGVSSKVPPKQVGKLRIVFTGGVYTANEDAILCFLEAVKKLKYVEVIFATPSQKEYLRNVNIGFVPKKVCYELQRSADILLLPLAFKSPYPEEIQCAFPTKALEYLITNKPILAIVPKGTFCQDFVEKNHVGMVVTELSEQKIAGAIEKLRDPRNRGAFSQNSMKTAFLYNARIQAKKLYTIIRKVVSNSESGNRGFL